jgi:DNA-binding LacI/PurR family transcriptional regulator
MTVSRVLSGDANVKAAMRQRVQARGDLDS